MQSAKTLRIQGAIIEKRELEKYLENIASDHILEKKSSKNTYPIYSVINNLKYIIKTYDILNNNLKNGIAIHPAGEWILDNLYIIEESAKSVIKELSLKKYKNTLGLANGMYKGFARIYVLASEIVAYTDSKIDGKILKDLLSAYQRKKTLNMEEIWDISVYLKIALIENISVICEKIYSAEIQKCKVENIIERLVEKKEKKKLKIKDPEKIKSLNNEEFKYPFIEYMSYKLKKYGKMAISYTYVLEEQVEKMGTSVAEVIKKEHYDMAIRKMSIGNSIKSLKELQTINFLEIFETINGVEEILRKDPEKIYTKMSFKTKSMYRNAIKELSKKTKISEIYIAKKALTLAIQNKEMYGDTDKREMPLDRRKKHSHIGYYLIDKGLNELIDKLEIRKNRSRNKKNVLKDENCKIKIYCFLILIVSLAISMFSSFYFFKQTSNIVFSLLEFLIIFIPATEIVIQIFQYVLNKTVKKKEIPKLDLSDGVPEELSTMVVIPTILNNREKVKELMRKLEVFYLANKSENLYFCLLGDVTSSSKLNEEFDDEIIEEGLKEYKRLNERYSKEKQIPKFHFMYRNRVWCRGESCYLGWERKRGLLTQFNEYLLCNEENQFRTNTLEDYKYGITCDKKTDISKKEAKQKLPQIKYIITLDADTNLSLNSGLELIGAMAHVLNKPVINDAGIVSEGYGIMQPRVGVGLLESRKSLFTQIYASDGGVDLYANAISDIYQDNFGEGIYTGKGIYDLSVFSKVLKDEIPENTVLSHDLLEGNYLRCGLANDIVLLDGYPYKYNAFISRQHRWIRGDWQIIRWLKKYIRDKDGNIKQNPLNFLSKFKIIDNLRRSLVESSLVINIIFLILLGTIYKTKFNGLIVLTIIAGVMPFILDLINSIVFKRENIKKQKTFVKRITGLKASMLRSILNFSVLPYQGYIALNAIFKTMYRVKVTKRHLLEWCTAEEAEKTGKTDLFSYYKTMIINVICAIIMLLWSPILSLFWIIGPLMMWYISKENKENSKLSELTEDDKNYIIQVGKETWSFFEEYINKQNNFLPPDNYQEERSFETVNRTSSTNIGLALLTIVSAYDLGYIDLEKCLNLLEKMLEVIQKLEKWNGHLYNWYNINTLKPLIPRYISTVDSGNFIGYLYTLKSFLMGIDEQNVEMADQYNLKRWIKELEKIIEETDFSVLYSSEKGIFSIGFNIEENKLTDSYYDLLASEARQASLIAIAKKNVTAKHWNNLSRTLTVLDKHKGLISWSGTAFEYFMPNINIPKYPGSLLDESSKFMLMSQKKYAKKLGTAWGISESAFNLRDLNSNYQYKAFGIPWLGLKRGLADEMVISSYGSVLTITENPKEVVENLKSLEKQGMHSKFGFYEALDYTPERLSYGKVSEPVKTYMAHHQALILLSINNLFNDNILQKRFMKNPEIEGLDILLQEKMPETALVTKEKKEKVEKIKYIGYETYSENVYTKIDDRLNRYNVISNGEYSTILNERGEGYSKYKDLLVNRYKETQDVSQGINVYIKKVTRNVGKELWGSIYSKNSKIPDVFTTHFMPNTDKFIRKDGAIQTTTRVVIDPNNPIEVRSIEIRNDGNLEECFEVTGYIEPVLSKMEQDYAHMAFNNLFLKYEKNEEDIIVKRCVRDKDAIPIYLATNLVSNGEEIGDLEYEINKSKLYGGNIDIPKMIQNSLPFSNSIGLIVEPCIALKRTVKVKPNEKVILNFIISIGEDRDEVINNLNKYKNFENSKRIYDLSRVKSEEEARYLGVKGEEILVYQKLMSYLLFQNPIRQIKMAKIKDEALKTIKYTQRNLWKYGVSGDLPILLLKVKSVNDRDIIKEVLKAFEYLRTKNIYVDLIILNEEENSYERYVKDMIQTEILNSQLGYLQNTKSGIYILDLIELEDKNLIEFVSNLVIDAKFGDLSTNIKDLEEEILEENENQIINKKIKNEIISKNSNNNKVKENDFQESNLKYYNGYGGFSEDGKEYKFIVSKENKLPSIWSHVLSNKKFGTVVTHNIGGYTWSRNSRLNRITAWTNNSVVDIPSEIIYIQDEETKEFWTLSDCLNKNNVETQVTYGFGYAKFNMKYNELNHNLDIFVPTEDKVKINILHLENKKPEKRKLRIVYYLKPVLDEDELKSNGYIDISKHSNVILAESVYSNGISNYMYVSSSESIKNYTGDKKFFMGEGNLSCPQALIVDSLNNRNSLGLSSCLAVEIEVEMEAFSTKDISFILGEEEKTDEIKNMANKYTNINNCEEELRNTKKHWNELLGRLSVNTPVESMNILLNGWLSYQSIACRLYARSGFYQSGGAFGFRDQLQDTLGMKFISEEFMKNQIIKHCSHQFLEGDVEHWWHEETNCGIRTRFSDDLLWLVYVVEEYIAFTGNMSILDEEVEYRTGEILQNGEDEKYEEHLLGETKESIYKHCLRAIDRSLNFGINGLPKIGSGDWNDGFSTVGNKGKGESVWLGFFLYDILIKFIEISKRKGEAELTQKYEEIVKKLKKSLNEAGWDGRWYKRAFTDNGEILGSVENEECKIDNISQTWSIISNAGDNDKKYICLESLEKHLIDTENGIIKLLDPPFEKSTIEPGYIKAYLPGVRENGGQYTHASCWTIIAEAILGFGEKAVDYFRLINPIEHSKTLETARRYKVEPYVVAADIYGKDNLLGQGGWTWYTGASSWLYKAGIEYILGLKIENKELRIEPSIPKEWEGFSIQYKYKSSIYNIKYDNKVNNEKKIYVNGEEMKEEKIRLVDDGKVYNVEVKG